MLEHHRGRPDLTDGVGDALAVDVRRRAVHRLEQGGEAPFRIEVGRRRDADGPGTGRPQVGQDVTEQVRGHHHVEPVRMQDEVRGQDVDVVLAGSHAGIGGGHLVEALVPERHGDRDAVGLGGRGDVPGGPAFGELEGEPHDAIRAVSREDALLQDRLALGALEDAAAQARVLALGVLPDHVEVDVADLPARQRRGHAGHEPHRSQVHVLVELAPQRDQHAPERDVIRHRLRPADGAEEDGVVTADPLLSSRPASSSRARGSSPSSSPDARTRTRRRTCARPPPARAAPPERPPCRSRLRVSPRSGAPSSGPGSDPRVVEEQVGVAAAAELAGHDRPPALSPALVQARLADACPGRRWSRTRPGPGRGRRRAGRCVRCRRSCRERSSSSSAASPRAGGAGSCCPGRRWCRRRPGRRSGRRRAGRCVRCRRSCRGRWPSSCCASPRAGSAGSCCPGRRWCRRRRGRRSGRRRAGRCVRCRRSCRG